MSSVSTANTANTANTRTVSSNFNTRAVMLCREIYQNLVHLGNDTPISMQHGDILPRHNNQTPIDWQVVRLRLAYQCFERAFEFAITERSARIMFLVCDALALANFANMFDFAPQTRVQTSSLIQSQSTDQVPINTGVLIGTAEQLEQWQTQNLHLMNTQSELFSTRKMDRLVNAVKIRDMTTINSLIPEFVDAYLKFKSQVESILVSAHEKIFIDTLEPNK